MAARLATQTGGIDSLESILGLLKSVKIPSNASVGGDVSRMSENGPWISLYVLLLNDLSPSQGPESGDYRYGQQNGLFVQG